MFGKNKNEIKKRPLGQSFPFMDRFQGGTIPFDKLQVEKIDDRLSFIFYNNEVPFYCVTYDVDRVDDFTYTYSDGIKGEISYTID